MPELSIQGRAVGGGPGRDFFRNLLEGFKVGGTIPVAPFMIGNDGDPAAEKLGEFGMHGGKMNPGKPAGQCEFRFRSTKAGSASGFSAGRAGRIRAARRIRIMSSSVRSRRSFVGTLLLSGAAMAAGESPQRLRVAVIGHTGRGAYGHGLDTLWAGLPEVELIAVADADGAGLAKALQRLNLTRGFRDYREMLAVMKPELVAIAPRHIDEHRDMALAAIEAGVRGIYMEKPFCRSPREADEIVAAAARENVKIALAHRNRYHPALPMAKRLVDDGTLGRLLEIRCRGKEDARGGMQDLWVLGSHVLNLAVSFAGPAVACTATVLKAGRPVTGKDVVEGKEGIGPVAGDEVHGRFETQSGVPLFFDSIAQAGVKEAGFGLQLIGTKGVIDLRMDIHPLARWLAGNPFQSGGTPRSWIPITSAGLGEKEPLADLRQQVDGHGRIVRDLIAAVRENRRPLCDAEDGAMTVEMISAVMESHRQGGRRVALPLAVRDNPFAGFAAAR